MTLGRGKEVGSEVVGLQTWPFSLWWVGVEGCSLPQGLPSMSLWQSWVMWVACDRLYALIQLGT